MRTASKTITTKQVEILKFIYKSLYTKHTCPSVREICAAVHLSSTASVQNNLTKLQNLGYIIRQPNTNRTITFTEKALDMLRNQYLVDVEVTSSPTVVVKNANVKEVPIVGTVQAGSPITAIHNLEDTIALPVKLTGDSDCFLLRVQGESMINIGIFEGDMLIVRQQNTANNGDVVVARIEDEATVKRFYKESDHIRLQPENDDFDPIITKECHIEGLVIGLVRDRI